MTPTNQKDLLQSQTNAEDQNRETSSLITNEQIEGTPFHIVGQNEMWFLVIGNHRITEPCESKIIAMDKLKTEKWKIILQLIVIVNEKSKQFAEIEKLGYKTKSDYLPNLK